MTRRLRRSNASEHVTRLHEHKGFVYLISADAVGMVKIGYTNAPDSRLIELQTGSPVRLRIVGLLPGSPQLEASLHASFEERRSHGEWFHAADEIFEAFGIRR